MLPHFLLLISIGSPAIGCASSVQAQGAPVAAQVPAVPTGEQYAAMTPEERYALRLRVRSLPDEVRKPWLAKLKAVVDSLPEETRLKLHNERNAMDAVHGTRPVE